MRQSKKIILISLLAIVVLAGSIGGVVMADDGDDNVDIPNVNKLSLYGPDLIGTKLFEEYGKHGDLWYIVARSKKHGYVVGVTRDVSVTIFNIVDKNKYLDYVAEEIYPLIL